VYIRGVDLHAPLVDAHAAGRLVVFVGAGASMGAPSSLPSFKDLVKSIRNASMLEAVFTDSDLDELPLDEILGRIEGDHGVDVHRQIFELVSRAGSSPSPLHEAIANLVSKFTIRLVTTNYDAHLSTVLQPFDVPQYLGPALPMGDDFNGIVYIHGRLDQENRRLIATDRDFGKAYLNDAWAARFLDRMFGEYPVLFVGYSHNDTIMKYLARGLGGRSEKRYALTSDLDDKFWRRLGITPVQCPRDDQPNLLNDWAERSAEGLLGARNRVKSLVKEQDPSPVPDSISFLEGILAKRSTVRFFREFARGAKWLEWAATRPEFATLLQPAPPPDAEIARELSFWFAENYVTEADASDVAFDMVTNNGGYLGDDLLFAVSRELGRSRLPLSQRMRRWLLTVASNRENRFTASFVGMLLSDDALQVDPDTSLFLLDYLTEPRIVASAGFSPLFGASFEPVTRDSFGTLRDVWQRAFRPFIGGHAARFIDIAERHLRRADLQLAVAGESDRDRPSNWRPSIVADDADLESPLGLLIDIARESLEHLIRVDSAEVVTRLSLWEAGDVALLQRLALYGWTIRSDVSAAEKLRWLISTGWLHDPNLRREAEILVLSSSESAGEDAITALVSDIRQHWEDDAYAPRRAYMLLTAIDEATRS
jgi:hypothetical protein